MHSAKIFIYSFFLNKNRKLLLQSTDRGSHCNENIQVIDRMYLTHTSISYETSKLSQLSGDGQNDTKNNPWLLGTAINFC